MIEIDKAGLGARIAKYRKLNGLSAALLAELVGGGVTRSVIANIESGRRADVSLDQILAIAWALRLPPVALIVPITRPNANVDVGDRTMTVVEFVEWFNGSSRLNPFDLDQSNAGLEARQVLQALERFTKAQLRLADLIAERQDWDDSGISGGYFDALEEVEKQLEVEKSMLRLLGVELDG